MGRILPQGITRGIRVYGIIHYDKKESTFFGEIVGLPKLSIFRGGFEHDIKEHGESYCIKQAKIAFWEKRYDDTIKYFSMLDNKESKPNTVIKKYFELSQEKLKES